MRVRSLTHGSILALAWLSACSRDPDLAPVHAAIERMVRGPDGDFACRVENVEVAEFVDSTTALGTVRTATWSAILIAEEELIAVLDRIDGHDLVVRLADPGATFRFTGDVEVRGPAANRRIEAHASRSELRELADAARLRLGGVGDTSTFRLRGGRRVVDPIEWESPAGSALRARERDRRAAESAAPHARLLQVVAPPFGALLHRDGDELRASRLVATSIDPTAGFAEGRGIDLASIPPREFRFELRSDPRGAGALELTRSAGAPALRFTRGDDGRFQAGRDHVLAAADQSRSKAFTEIESAVRAAWATLTDSTAASAVASSTDLTREGFVELALEGSVVHGDRVDRARASLFRLPSQSPTNWREGAIAVRLASPLLARGVLVRGGAVASGPFEVLVNGLSRARLESLAAGTAVVVRLPDDTPVVDVAILAHGALSLRCVSAVR